MDPFTIALGLANFAPALMRYLGVGEKNVIVAEKAISIAKGVTGSLTGEEALHNLTMNSEKAHDFRMAIMRNDRELEQAYLADVASARKRDELFIKSGRRNHRADLMLVLAVVIVVGIAIAIWSSPNLDEYTKGIATLILGRFLGYLDAIYNFEYSSTRSSKIKDATIEQLSKGAHE